MDKLCHPILYNGCNYLSILGLKVIHISQRGPSKHVYTNEHQWDQDICDHSLVMMTSSNGNIFRVTGHLCGEFTGPRWIPRTKASDADLDVIFDLRPSKQWLGWWFETLSSPLWRHCNVCTKQQLRIIGLDRRWFCRESIATERRTFSTGRRHHKLDSQFFWFTGIYMGHHKFR